MPKVCPFQLVCLFWQCFCFFLDSFSLLWNMNIDWWVTLLPVCVVAHWNSSGEVSACAGNISWTNSCYWLDFIPFLLYFQKTIPSQSWNDCLSSSARRGLCRGSVQPAKDARRARARVYGQVIHYKYINLFIFFSWFADRLVAMICLVSLTMRCRMMSHF